MADGAGSDEAVDARADREAGAARAINPYQTQSDGDQILAVSTGAVNPNGSLTPIGAIAAEVVGDAILRAVRAATGLPGWLSVKELL